MYVLCDYEHYHGIESVWGYFNNIDEVKEWIKLNGLEDKVERIDEEGVDFNYDTARIKSKHINGPVSYNLCITKLENISKEKLNALV